MNLLYIDFETYWDKDITLKKLTYNEYIFHEGFEVQMCAVAINDNPIEVLSGSVLEDFFNSLNWEDTAIVAHNVRFDGAILTWVYNCHPAFFYCTQDMSHFHWATLSNSLENTCIHVFPTNYRLRKTKELHNTKGVRELSPELYSHMARYCHNDTFLCRAIFYEMLDGIPAAEFDIIDHTVRQFLYPRMIVDKDILNEIVEMAQQEKIDWRKKVGATSKQLNSPQQFADLLIAEGVTPPTKISEKTEKETFAFSKQDLAFQELMVHPSQRVRDLISARLINSSTQMVSRSNSLLTASHYHDGLLPVPMKYAAAKTRRFGGTQKINMLNIPKKGRMREAIQAPPGFVLVTADMSQIEARLLAYIAKQLDMLADFANPDIDIYCSFGENIYGHYLDKKTESDERFVSKGAVLGLGYMLAAAGFNRNIQAMAKTYLDKDIILGPDFSQDIVTAYRTKYTKIPELWKILDGMVNVMKSTNVRAQCTWGMFKFLPGKIIMPDGCAMQYSPEMMENLYGGKLTENIMQGLGRILLVDYILKIEKEIAPVTFSVYDEVTCIAPESRADDVLASMIEVMSGTMDWCPDIPLAAEGAYKYHYCK